MIRDIIKFFYIMFGLVGVTTYYGCGIMYLIFDKNKLDSCNKTHIWEYVLFSLVLTILTRYTIHNIMSSSNNSAKSLMMGLTFVGTIELSLIIWGSVELYSDTCSDIKNTRLWIFALITYIIQIIVATTCFSMLTAILIRQKNNNIPDHIELQDTKEQEMKELELF